MSDTRLTWRVLVWLVALVTATVLCVGLVGCPRGEDDNGGAWPIIAPILFIPLLLSEFLHSFEYGKGQRLR